MDRREAALVALASGGVFIAMGFAGGLGLQLEAAPPITKIVRTMPAPFIPPLHIVELPAPAAPVVVSAPTATPTPAVAVAASKPVAQSSKPATPAAATPTAPPALLLGVGCLPVVGGLTNTVTSLVSALPVVSALPLGSVLAPVTGPADNCPSTSGLTPAAGLLTTPLGGLL